MKKIGVGRLKLKIKDQREKSKSKSKSNGNGNKATTLLREMHVAKGKWNRRWRVSRWGVSEDRVVAAVKGGTAEADQAAERGATKSMRLTARDAILLAHDRVDGAGEPAHRAACPL